MHEIAEIILTLKYSSIAALAWGPKHGKPILALHGWLDNAASFLPLAPYLSEYRVIAIDLPGHGLSSHIPTGTFFHFEDYVANVVNILDYLGWEKSAILGHSLGAGIGSIVAGTIPHRITKLGLLDGIGSITAPVNELPNMMHKSIEEYSRLDKKKPRYHASKEEAVNARLSASNMLRTSAELIVSRGLQDTDRGYTWRTDPRLLLTPLVMPIEAQLKPFLERITSDTCLIRPSSGSPFDQKTTSDRVDLVKNITVHSVEGEHHVHMDHPERVGPILKEFFA